MDGFLDGQGGRFHLWLALGAVLMASIAAGLMSLFFLGGGKGQRHEAPPPFPDPQSAFVKVTPDAGSPHTSSWAQRNEWCVEGQADDRRPNEWWDLSNIGSGPARRSLARLSHQMNYKDWSKESRD